MLSTPPASLPALLFEPDGYVLNGPTLMGRHSAGNGFLRAAVAASIGGPLVACTPREASARVFVDLARSIHPQARPQWVQPDHFDALASLGGLYVPGPTLSVQARQRLRAGPGAYSLCGVTHTLSTHAAMEAVRDWLTAPLMPWDAVVCTSSAARAVVQRVLAAEADYLHWRFGVQPPLAQPELPVIPLGVHAQDFAFGPAQRQAARQALGLGPDDVAVLFAGRLSFHAKAHPHPMYAAMQAVARQTGAKLALLQCGWFANEPIEQAFKQGARQTCPDVRCDFIDGRNDAQRQHAWAAADVFISLSDNLQETFGLTPIEAMAAGLPAVVSDWNGYKDTVRDGRDGFRIATHMPAPDTAEPWSARYDCGTLNHDTYCGLSSQAVAVCVQSLTERLAALVTQPALRQQMGQSGRERVAQHYEWAQVFAQYQALWAEQAQRRQRGVQDPRWRLAQAPRHDAARPSPFRAFEGYASQGVSGSTVLQWQAGHTVDSVMALLATPLFSHALPAAPEQRARMAQAFGLLLPSPMSVASWARHCQAPEADLVLMACQLLKLGAVRAQAPGPQPDQG